MVRELFTLKQMVYQCMHVFLGTCAQVHFSWINWRIGSFKREKQWNKYSMVKSKSNYTTETTWFEFLGEDDKRKNVQFWCLLKITHVIIWILLMAFDSLLPKMNKFRFQDEACSFAWWKTWWKHGPSLLLFCFLRLLPCSLGPPPATADVVTTIYWAVLLSHYKCNGKRVTPDNLGVTDTQRVHTPQGQTWHVTTVSSF